MKNTKNITNSKSTDNESTNNDTCRYAVMTDFAIGDRRSVAAWLRGVRDGREEAWEAYRKKMRVQHPELDDADLTQCYAVYVRTTRKDSDLHPINKLIRMFWPIISFLPLRLPADFYERRQVYGQRNAKVLIALCLAILVCAAYGWSMGLAIAFVIGLVSAGVIGLVLANAVRDGDWR